MTQTKETGFVTTLAGLLEPSDTSLTVATAPTVTKGRLYLTNGQQEEWIAFSGVSGTTLQNLTRGLSQTADPATAGTGLTRVAGTKVKLVIMHDQLLDKLEGDQAIIEAKVYATTAARDADLGGDGVATKNYNNIKCTDTGEFYRYNTSTNVWENYDTGTTTANGSETVAGKYEEGTDAENTAGDATGGTGAKLVVTPAKNAKVIQSGSYLYAGASAAGTDTYVVTMTPTLTAYTTGMEISFKADVANTGACTINVDSLGAKSIKTLDGNDPQDGAIRANQFVALKYDGTNFVMQHEDFGSTSNRGIHEMATDTEAYARTSEILVVNPKQLGDSASMVVLSISRAMNGASGAVTTAHGLTKIPTGCTSFWNVSNEQNARGQGMSDGSNNACVYHGETGSGGSTTLVIGESSAAGIVMRCTPGTTSGQYTQQSGVITFDATNVTITWTKTSSGTESTETGRIKLLVY